MLLLVLVLCVVGVHHDDFGDHAGGAVQGAGAGRVHAGRVVGRVIVLLKKKNVNFLNTQLIVYYLGGISVDRGGVSVLHVLK